MAYQNFLGEFVAPFEKEDWPKYVRWNERRPLLLRGALNPWEVERIRYVWEQEKTTWPKIEALRKEYYHREGLMRSDFSIFYSHIKELERITKRPIGLGGKGKYAVMAAAMAMAMIPGYGWLAAAFTLVMMGIDMLLGNKKIKRIKQLMQIVEDARLRLELNQKRLWAIGDEIVVLMNVTGKAVDTVNVKFHKDLYELQKAQQLRDEQTALYHVGIDKELSQIRQVSPKRVTYADTL